jgi:hypothetical protein
LAGRGHTLAIPIPTRARRGGSSYDIVRGGWKFIERGTLNVIVDHMMFDYEDFRDLRVTGGVAG